MDIGDPVPHRLVDRILERAAARVHAPHRGAEQLHPQDVGRLPFHVFRAHVDVAAEAEQRAGRRRGDAVLSRAGLRDHTSLPHPLCKERLAERVVDLVCAGVGQVFALQKDPGATGVGGQPGGLVQRCGTPHVVGQELTQPPLKGGIDPNGHVFARQDLDRLDQRFGHVAAAKLTEVAARIRVAVTDASTVTLHDGAHDAASTLSSARNNARRRSGSLIPGACSTPDETSTAAGRTRVTADAMLAGVMPPASTVGR